MRKVLQTTKTKLGNTVELVSIGEVSAGGVLIIGVFHGDEPQGKFLIDKYISTVTNTSEIDEENPSPYPSPTRGEGIENITYINTKNLRSNMTDAEMLLWRILRAKRFYGLKFRRQVPIGKYIVDFLCHSANLVIELDGGQHNQTETIEYDQKRSEFLKKEGYTVLRFWNNEIFENLSGVCERILEASKPFLPENMKEQEGSLAPCGTLAEPTNVCESSETACRMAEELGRGVNKLFIPCLNPDGFALGTRTNANRVDLNRNFPTKNWGEDGSGAGSDASAYFGGDSPASEIETKFVIEVIEKYSPSLIITLHAPYKVVNYDGPAQTHAEMISKIIGYPVEASIGYPTPGSFGTYCGVERNIPTITLELDEEIPVENLLQPVFEIFDIL